MPGGVRPRTSIRKKVKKKAVKKKKGTKKTKKQPSRTGSSQKTTKTKRGFGEAKLFAVSFDEYEVWLIRCKREEVLDAIEDLKSLTEIDYTCISGETKYKYPVVSLCGNTIEFLDIEIPESDEVFEFDATLIQVGKGKVILQTVLEGL